MTNLAVGSTPLLLILLAKALPGMSVQLRPLIRLDPRMRHVLIIRLLDVSRHVVIIREIPQDPIGMHAKPRGPLVDVYEFFGIDVGVHELHQIPSVSEISFLSDVVFRESAANGPIVRGVVGVSEGVGSDVQCRRRGRAGKIAMEGTKEVHQSSFAQYAAVSTVGEGVVELFDGPSDQTAGVVGVDIRIFDDDIVEMSVIFSIRFVIIVVVFVFVVVVVFVRTIVVRIKRPLKQLHIEIRIVIHNQQIVRQTLRFPVLRVMLVRLPQPRQRPDLRAHPPRGVLPVLQPLPPGIIPPHGVEHPTQSPRTTSAEARDVVDVIEREADVAERIGVVVFGDVEEATDGQVGGHGEVLGLEEGQAVEGADGEDVHGELGGGGCLGGGGGFVVARKGGSVEVLEGMMIVGGAMFAYSQFLICHRREGQ
mmetsp:Transcript_29/g.79  ORF Transcript_29/g.79 Transcript_29/m.79 type:complete len:422 (+) Transcript_29:350-1615(+)